MRSRSHIYLGKFGYFLTTSKSEISPKTLTLEEQDCNGSKRSSGDLNLGGTES